MMLDASETYTVLNTYRDQQHIQFSQHFMPRLARTRLAKTRKSDLNLKSPLQTEALTHPIRLSPSWPLILWGVRNAARAAAGARARPAPSRVSLGRPVTEFWAPVDAGNVARAGVAEHAKTLDPA